MCIYTSILVCAYKYMSMISDMLLKYNINYIYIVYTLSASNHIIQICIEHNCIYIVYGIVRLRYIAYTHVSVHVAPEH